MEASSRRYLYLTGADSFTSGITGAMMGGIKTACLLNGAFGYLKIMSRVLNQPA